MEFDKRVTAARFDLAAAHLEGQVYAGRYVQGRAAQVARGVVGLHDAPTDGAGLHTQLLFGEGFTIYDEKFGWVWGQAALDNYVGYARADSFIAPLAPTHRVISRSTPLFHAAEVRKGARDMLPMNAKVAILEDGKPFAKAAKGGHVFAGHLAALDSHVSDWVSVAEQFVGVPYLWGGKTAAGFDCSGLVQTALEAGGIKSPRDTDMMESALGDSVPSDAPLRRGDLIFWKGHVGVMLDGTRIVHANGYFMQVSVEPFALVRDRTQANENLPVRSIKRL